MKAVLRLCSFFLLISLFSTFGQDLPAERVLHLKGSGSSTNLNSPNGVNGIMTALPNNGYYSSTTKGPNAGTGYQRNSYFITAAELAAAGFPSGFVINSIGFNIFAQAPATATTGNFKVYLMNAPDTTSVYGRGNQWPAIISGMTLAHNGTITIPTTPGTYDVPFTGGSAFTYTGGALYIAFEFQNTSTIAPSVTQYLVNAKTGTWMYFGISTTRFSDTLSTSTASRPETRLGIAVANDGAVDAIYTLGKLPTKNGLPHRVSAVVRNNGDNAISNLAVTLNITGANTFSNTQTVASLASGASTVVTFSAFSPSTLGVDTVRVTLPADDITSNNVKTTLQTVTNGTFAYSDGSTTFKTAYGFGAANSGAFLSKYFVNGPATLNSVTCFVYSGTGNTVRGVAYNKAGTLIAQSSDHVLVAADTMHYVTFTFTTPPTISSDSVYVGLWETPSVNFSYYPIGTQAEEPTRYGASYELWQGALIDDGGPGGAGKYMIEANFTPEFSGKVFLSEDFTGYTVGGLAGQNGWTKVGYDSVEVANTTPLTYPGYLYGGSEYVKSIVNSATTGRVYRDFTDSLSITQPGAVAYCSMLLKVNTSFTTATNYFFSLGQAPGTSNYFAKLFAKNISDTTYYLGVSKSSNTASFVTTPMKTNQTYLVLIRYNGNNTGLNQNSNTAYMWINPVGTSEPDTALADAKVFAGQNDYSSSNISAVIFHNRGTSNPYFSADGIRVAGSPNSSADAWTSLNPGSLPVELSSFTAVVSGKSVNLSWRTASEINNRGFFVERKSENSSWTTLTFVNGNGSSLDAHQYNFTDNTVTSGKYSYRLKQVDFNGTASLSSEVNVDLTTPVEYTLGQNYPNPFNPSTKISYQLPVDSRVKVELYSITGQKVADLVNKDQSAGTYSIEVNSNILRNIASGVYIYRMTATSKVNGVNFISAKKMMLMK